MAKTSPQSIINLLCIFSVFCTFVLLLLFWNSFTNTKIIILFLFMALFMYIMFKNSHAESDRYTKKYPTISPYNFKKSKNNIATKLTQFFDNIQYNSQRTFNQSSFRPRWNTGLTYSSEIQMISKPDKSGSLGYNSTRYQENDRSQIESKSQQINIFIPQNISSMMEEIRQKIKPSKYMKEFQQNIEALRGQKRRMSPASKKLFNQDSPFDSFSLDKEKKFVFVQSYEIKVEKEVDCAQTISEFIESRLEQIMKQSNYSFKVVSETMIKCFGLKVNFYLNQKEHIYDSREVSFEELREFLYRFRRESYVPQKFKPLIPIKEFMRGYLQKLVTSSDYIEQFLECIEDQNMMALKIYVDILKKYFDQDDIQMSRNLSSYSAEMKNTKHAIYVHKGGRNTFFTYNRIQNFRTQSPLVVLMAFFADNYKNGSNLSKSIVRDVSKYFIQRSKEA